MTCACGNNLAPFVCFPLTSGPWIKIVNPHSGHARPADSVEAIGKLLDAGAIFSPEYVSCPS